jgi:transcriptional regulator with XRE-family HTH domain
MAIMDTDLKALRKAMGLRQHELAEMLIVSQPTISAVETGRRQLTRRTRWQLAELIKKMPKDKRPPGWEGLLQ